MILLLTSIISASEILNLFVGGYNGSNCATLFGLIVPSISVQTVPV
jgi:uncharacterized membrane protein